MCTITLTELRGVQFPGGAPFNGPGSPPYLRVTGTITGCPPAQTGASPTVTVSTACGQSQQVVVNAAGAFTAYIANTEHCACDTPRWVRIKCDNSTDPTCDLELNGVMLQCGPPPPPPCPTGSPLDPNITITESACNAMLQRDVRATVAVNAGWAVSLIEWSWDGAAAVPSSPPTNPTSPPMALAGNMSHDVVATATLAAPNGHCRYSRFKTFPVTTCDCPPGTPFGPNITFNEGACSNGTRLVDATVTLDPAWNVTGLEWSWDGAAPIPSNPPTNTTSPPIALSAGMMHSVVVRASLAAPDAHCRNSMTGTFAVTACQTTPPPCPTGSPFGPNITFTESATCDASGQRDVQATVTLNPGWAVDSITWQWDAGAAVPTSPSTSTTSPSVALGAGVTHDLVVTAVLAAPNAHCRYVATQRVPVSACPVPPPTPTTPTPTTPTPTTPTPTTPTTPSSAGCAISLVAAWILLGLGAVSLGLGGCLGPAGAVLIAAGIGLGAAGLIVLGLWIFFCRDCLLMRFMQRFFGAMALFMLVLVVLLTLVGMLTCATGAVFVAALFGAMVGLLTLGLTAFGCP